MKKEANNEKNIKESVPYEHHAQYYETDQMGIIHHSNYIRWMEEARIDVMKQLGISYKEMEDEGIIIPVLSVNCEYKKMFHFDETACIEVKIERYNGIRFFISYIMSEKETGEIRTIGESSHCFLDKKGIPVSLKRSYPEFHRLFESA